MGNLSGLLYKWDPDTMFRAQEGHLGLKVALWRVLCTAALTLLTLASLSLNHEAPLLGM